MLVLFWYWLICLLAIVAGFLGISVKSWCQIFIADLYVFGKTRQSKNLELKDSIFQVPKCWFRHMYITGVVVNTFVFGSTLHCYFVSGEWPTPLKQVLIFLGNSDNGATFMDPLPILLALAMEEIQVIRRCYETQFVNVYSDSRMSWVIYLVGLMFYSLIGISILSLAPSDKVNIGDLLSTMEWYHVLSVVIFLYASWKQYKVNWIMAKLRKNKHGNVENTGYHMPTGDLFEYVSCPHYLMEIVIYLCIASVFLWRHQVCTMLAVFVAANQVVEGYVNHQWYLETFPKYPKKRKAIIPYLL